MFLRSPGSRHEFRRGCVSALITAGLLGLIFTPRATPGAEPGPGVAANGLRVPSHCPPGFVAEGVAGPTLVEPPMFACFDDRGRLYVADSTGENPSGDDLARNPPHRIRRLEDRDGDGRFD